MKHKLATFSNLALTVENVFFFNLVNNTSTASHVGPNEICFICPKLRLLVSVFSVLIPKNTAYLFYVFFCIHFFNWVRKCAFVYSLDLDCKCSLKEMIMLYVATVQSFGISNTFCSWFNGFCLRWLIGQTYSLPLPLQKHSWQQKKKIIKKITPSVLGTRLPPPFHNHRNTSGPSYSFLSDLAGQENTERKKKIPLTKYIKSHFHFRDVSLLS